MEKSFELFWFFSLLLFRCSFVFSSPSASQNNGEAQRNKAPLAQRTSHEYWRVHKRHDSPSRGRNQGEKTGRRKRRRRRRKRRENERQSSFLSLSLSSILKCPLCDGSFFNFNGSLVGRELLSMTSRTISKRRRMRKAATRPRFFFFSSSRERSSFSVLRRDLHLTFSLHFSFPSLFPSSFRKKKRPPSRSARRPRRSTCLSRARTGLPGTIRGRR